MTDLVLSDQQAAALRAIDEWYVSGRQEFTLEGYAGTGKTTLLSHVLDHLRAHRGLGDLYVGAYTGKAAHVLRRKGNRGASTLHSMLYEPVPGSNPVRFQLAADPGIGYADLVVIDENSMVPQDMAADFRRHARRLLTIGDPAQLPPVRGLGGFADRRPDAVLTEVHRQALDDPILRLATKVRRGQLPTMSDAAANVAVAPARTWEQLTTPGAGQLLAGRHRTRFAVTRYLRDGAAASPFAGEPLVCRRNEHDRGLYNGMPVAASWVDGDRAMPYEPYLMDVSPVEEEEDGADVHRSVHRLKVASRPFRDHYDGAPTPLEYERGVSVLDWAYCLTVHAAQGSEYDAVTVIDDSAAFREDRFRWLYTAITRARSRLTLLLRS